MTAAEMAKRAWTARRSPPPLPRSSVASAGGWAARLLRANRFLRFLIVGSVNTAVGYGLFLGALAVLPTPTLALLAATVLSVLFNFFSTGRLVFESTDLRRLAGFLAVYGVVFAYNAVALHLLAQIGLGPRIGGALALPGAVALSFCLNRWVVFRRDRA